MIKHPLYDIAVAEVRGEATPAEQERLKINVFQWRDALQSVVDEVDSQLELKSAEFEDNIATYERLGNETALLDERHSYDVWKSRARTFKKHVSARLMAVKRMCQELGETSTSVSGSVEKAMGVASAAVALVDTDSDSSSDDEMFERAFDNLVSAVRDYQASLFED